MVSSLLTTVKAQTLKAEGPDVVNVDGNFRIEYTANSTSMSNFRLGNIPQEAFDVVFGPAVSTRSSHTIINGKATHESATTYTYTLVARKAGTYTIPAATAVVNGKQVSSNTLSIIVSGESSSKQSSSADIFMQVTPSKTRVYEQEPLMVSFKLYTSSAPTNISGDLGELKDFIVNRMDDPRTQISMSHELINGRAYVTLEWQKYLLFPQKSGSLEIPAVPFEVTTIRRLQNIDPFEEFMNGGSGEVYDKHAVRSKAVTIHVEPLPSQPTGFSGGVGQFTIESSLDNETPQTNDVITLKVKVSGHGNMNMLSKPIVEFPADFDTYEPQVTDQTQLTVNGYEGTIEYEYTAVPRNPGVYDIEPIRLVYFDPEIGDYRTATTEGYHLKVAKGKGGVGGSQDFANEQVNGDIFPIKEGDSELIKQEPLLFGSNRYVISLGVLFLVFISLFVIFHKRAIERADIVNNRAKSANKVATKRLRKAARLMKDNKPGEFYDEALRALWGYVGDRLNMPVEQLSRENITDRLTERRVLPETTAQFIEAIDECEFERYAPGDPKGNMQKVYQTAMTAIEHIETDMKRKIKKSGNIAKSIVLLLMLLPLSLSAATKQEADKAYLSGEYQLAISLYEEVLKEGSSAEVHYNLGNAYYRTENLKMAILNYERALLLAPSDVDIRHNLQVAQSKTIDKVTPKSEMFFITWYRSLTNLLTSNQWAWLAIISLAMAIVLALLYLFANGIRLRKLGFFGGVVMLVLFLLGNLFAWQQGHNEATRDGAIIMTATVKVKTTPSETAKDAFTLHEGTKVTIVDDSMKDWKQVTLSDGRSGWLPASDMEKI